MNISELLQATSRALNKVLFGARIALDEDSNSQAGTMMVAYLLNLVLVFSVVAGISASVGFYDPFHSPLAASNVQMPLAISNLVTFVLTYLASLSWKAHEKAIERRLTVNRSRGGFYTLLSALFLPSIIFCAIASAFLLGVLFHTLNVANLLGSFLVNSVILQVLFSERSLKRRDKGDLK
jgi:hypothetical protein